MQLEAMSVSTASAKKHRLQELIEEFMDSSAYIMKIKYSNADYASCVSCCGSLRAAVKRSRYPIKVVKRGEDIYLFFE